MTVHQGWNLIWMVSLLVVCFKLSKGCFPPSPPRCVGQPSKTEFTIHGEPCIFPFKYESKEYSQCADSDGVKFCATEIHRDCKYKRLGICPGSGPTSCPSFFKNKTRIVGGLPVKKPGDVPFQVAINWKKGLPFCGGSIIGTRWILSAAHCTEGKQIGDRKKEANEIEVLVGGTNWANNEMIKYDVSHKLIHEGYIKTYNPSYDILLLLTTKDIIMSQKVRTIQLQPLSTEINFGTCHLISGWGFLNAADITSFWLLPRDLHFTTVHLIKNDDCLKYYPDSHITEREVCSVSIWVNKDQTACRGDSGGPLVDVSTGKLIGVIQGSLKKRKCQSPTIYVRVAHKEILSFIERMSGIKP